MADFPNYAKLLLDGYSEQRESSLLRTEMESGPPKQARVKTLVLTKRTIAILLSRSDYSSFISWYKDTINDGADWFTYTDPVTNTTMEARFTGGGFTAQARGQSAGAWLIKATIETWS